MSIVTLHNLEALACSLARGKQRARPVHKCTWCMQELAPRRPLDWVLSMLDYLPMSMPTHEELLWRFGKAEDPVIEARRQRLLDFLLETSPQKKQQLQQEGQLEAQLEGRLIEARASLRLVLVNRQLTPSQDDDARIDACTDLATLERWIGRAITAASVADVLR
jgi:hypothetical protein